MKKLKRIIVVSIIVALVLALGGCGTSSGTVSSSAGEARTVKISFDNEAAGILTVTNNTSDTLVLFAGSIANQSIIGGIRNGPNQTRSFDIFGDVSEQNGAFLMRAIKESVYRKKGSAIDEDDVMFARLVTYDKNDRSQKTNIIIDKRVEGEAVVYFENDSNLVLEIRLDSPTGEKIATLPPFQRKKAIYLTPNRYGYTYFPTYIYYDTKQKDVRSITTTDLAKGKSCRPVVPGSGEDPQFVPFPKPNLNDIFMPVVTLVVSNESTNGIFFRSGTTPKESIRGNVMINSGGSETYEIDMGQLKTREIGGLNFDQRIGEENVVQIPAKTYSAGQNYSVSLRSNRTVLVGESGVSDDMSKLSIPLVNEYR
jgi:hypothetical protein